MDKPVLQCCPTMSTSSVTDHGLHARDVTWV